MVSFSYERSVHRMTEIAQRITKARESMNLTQAELAEKIKVSPAAISQYESGDKKPSIENLQKLSQALKVSTDYLMGKDSALPSDINALFRGIDKMDGIHKEQILGEMKNFYEFLKTKKEKKHE